MEKYKGGQTKIRWECDKYKNHIWEAVPSSILQGNGCPYCANQKILKGYNDVATTNSNILKIWDFEKNRISPYEIAANSGKKVWLKCDIGHSYNAPLYTVNKANHKCPYCNSHRVLIGFNDLWTTRPDVAQLLKDKNDGYKFTYNSNKKVIFICPKCGTEHTKSINLVSNHGFFCHYCSDGISFAEKYVSSMLNQINIKYIRDNVISWSKNKRYDFYIESMSLIIETHGSQHYEQSKTFKRTVFEEQENDLYKKDMALKNGIKKYIELDCRVSESSYIKKSILNSELSLLFDLSNIDWEKCLENTFTSNVIIACDLYNSGESTQSIADKLKINISTIVKYLKKCNSIELCSYDVNDIKNKTRNNFVNLRKRSVICIETNKIFESIVDVKKYFNIVASSISACCNNKRETAGGFHWMYYEDYLKQIEENNNKEVVS